MARRKAGAAAAAAAPAPGTTNTSTSSVAASPQTLTPDSSSSSSHELQSLNLQAKQQQQQQQQLQNQSFPSSPILHPLLRALALLSLAALSSHASQLALAPVYGAIPASLHHRAQHLHLVVGAVGATARFFAPPRAAAPPRSSTTTDSDGDGDGDGNEEAAAAPGSPPQQPQQQLTLLFLCVLAAAWAPLAQRPLFALLSGRLGAARGGPQATEALTLAPVLAASAAAAARALAAAAGARRPHGGRDATAEIHVSPPLARPAAAAAAAAAAYLYFCAVEAWAARGGSLLGAFVVGGGGGGGGSRAGRTMGWVGDVLASRVGLQLGIALLYAAVYVVAVVTTTTTTTTATKAATKRAKRGAETAAKKRRSSRLSLSGLLPLSPAAAALALPALMLSYTAALDTRLPAPWTTRALQASLAARDWSLLARRDSLTGYVAVIESAQHGFRLLRCDHSLLGGEWVRMPQEAAEWRRKQQQAGQKQEEEEEEEFLKEPVYAIFTMLEAVRLVEVEETVADEDASALVIGAGIGTTPSAFIAHGIDTTIVEIDRVVYDYAVEFFGLPDPHTAVIADAVEYVDKLTRDVPVAKHFNYIVHDVFTGGAEPVDLFTAEFLTGLRELLTPEGVIAINYAGDLQLPSSRLIMQTVNKVFPSCRTFTELKPATAEEIREKGENFINMVIFCTKKTKPTAAAASSSSSSSASAAAAAAITFREPVEADFLGSSARRAYLVPRYEMDAAAFREQTRGRRVEGREEEEEEEDVGVLYRNDTATLTRWQQTSAVGHWMVMRTVLPAWIWENY